MFHRGKYKPTCTHYPKRYIHQHKKNILLLKNIHYNSQGTTYMSLNYCSILHCIVNILLSQIRNIKCSPANTQCIQIHHPVQHILVDKLNKKTKYTVHKIIHTVSTLHLQQSNHFNIEYILNYYIINTYYLLNIIHILTILHNIHQSNLSTLWRYHMFYSFLRMESTVNLLINSLMCNSHSSSKMNKKCNRLNIILSHYLFMLSQLPHKTPENNHHFILNS